MKTTFRAILVLLLSFSLYLCLIPGAYADSIYAVGDTEAFDSGEPDPNYNPNAAVAAAAQEPEVQSEVGHEEVTAAQTSAPEDGDSSIQDNETPITNKAEDNFALILNDTESFDNAGIQIGDDAVFDAGSDLFETPILQKGGVAVSEAVSGDTLTVYVKASPDAPAGQTYQYRWIRDNGITRSLITGATGSTYTLTDADCGSSVYCSVNVYGKPNEAELSTGVHARKEISMSFAIRPVGGVIGGNVKLEFTDTLHAEYIFEPITYPEGRGNSFTVSKIRDINGVERPLMTEDSLNITVEPAEHSSETEKGYYVRYVALNDTIIINTTSQKASYPFESLSPENDADVISVFFDLAECQPNEKESQGPTTESDQQIHNNTKIWEEFEKKYVLKDEQEIPFPVVYYYVTPKWLGAPAVPMSSYEINAVGGFTFKLGLPSGVTAANFKDYNVKVYHYVANNADWEQVSYTTDTTIAKGEAAVQINNFTNFSPFAVVARPTSKIEFVNEEPAKGHVSNEPITADDKGDVVLPKAEFTAQEGYTFACWLVDDKPMLPGETVHNVFADKKVYPKWMQGFTITFDDNDADNQSTYGALVTGEMDKQTVFVDDDGNYLDYKGDKLEAAPRLNEHAFQLKNHSFQGWSDKPGSGDNKPVYADKQSVADVKEPYNLYAVWKREQVSIIFNANGGSGTMDEQKGPVGGNITLTANKFEAPDDNKLFAGWSKTVGGNVDYKNQATIDVPDTDTTLYAVWREKVTVRFNPKSTSDFYGGTGTGTMAGRYYPSGATVTLPKCEFTAPEGKAFAFWSDRQDGTGNIYPDKYEGYWTGNTELFAQWGDKLTIHYNPNGGDGTSKAQVAAQNVDVTLATAESAGFSRSGYKFLGWDTISSKKANPKYAGGETVKGGFDQDNVTLYAIWDQVEITGVVIVTGSLSGIDSLGFVGETLTAEVFDEKKFTDFTYEWTDDDGNVLGTQSTYAPTINDFGKTIVCTVTAHSPYESKETSNEKTIGIDEQDKRIINDGVTEKAYVYGLYPGMYYSTDGGKTKARVDKVPFELSRAGVYCFYANNTDNTILAVVNVENWYTIGYACEGSGTVRLTLGNTTLTSGTRFTGETAEYIEYYPGVSGYTSWIVKEGANIGSFTLTVSPSSGNYAHVYLNEELIDSFGTSSYSSSSSSSTWSRTYTVNTPLEYDTQLTTSPGKVFRIVFNRTPPTSDIIAEIDETTFPDPIFRDIILERYDHDRDGKLSKSEIYAVKTLSCSMESINSLKGIEYFTELTTLYCSDNNLIELDLSACKSLTNLNCQGNYLTQLDLSNCPELRKLICSGNTLKALDVSFCPALASLDCSSNVLVQLTLQNNAALTTLNCSNNNLTNLDLTGNSALNSLICYGNALRQVTLAENAALVVLNSSGNLLSSLDLGDYSALRNLRCSGNLLTELDLSGAPALNNLECQGNRLNSIGVANCDALSTVNCANNLLEQLNVSGCTVLKTLHCEQNQLTNLALTSCSSLKTLCCYDNNLSKLDLLDCPILVELVESREPVITGTWVTYGEMNEMYGSPVLRCDNNVKLNIRSSIVDLTPDLILPTALTTIDAEAFTGGAFTYVVLPDGAEVIGQRAFADCPKLAYIYIPASVTSIDENAFDGVTGLTILGTTGSEAENFAHLHGFAFAARQ